MKSEHDDRGELSAREEAAWEANEAAPPVAETRNEKATQPEEEPAPHTEPLVLPAAAAPSAPMTAPMTAPTTTPIGVGEAAEGSRPVPPLIPPVRPRPLLGALLMTFGALLWSFVVAGQFTTSWMAGAPLSEGAAILIVMVATVVAWVLSLRSGQLAAPTSGARMVGRAAASMLLAFVSWVFVVVMATIAGAASSKDHDVIIGCVLASVGIACTALGPRVISPAPRRPRSHGMRVAEVMVWLGLMIVTLIAGAELVANG